MEVVLNQIAAGPTGVHPAGTMLDLPEAAAKHLLDSKQAQTPAEFKARQDAERKARETAQGRGAPGRK